METLLQDIQYGFRQLRKTPGFTVVAVLTLALGIGANSAIFTVIDAAMFHALPFESPERLVHLWETRPDREFTQMEASRPNLLYWQESNHVFSGMAGYSGMPLSLLGRGVPKRLPAVRVTSNFFDVLGVQPYLGRTFQPGEDRPHGDPIAIISYGLWQTEFGADPKILGQALNISGQSYTVVGVLPAQFQFAKRGDAQLWIPLNPGAGLSAGSPGEADRRTFHWINMIARLKPSITLAQAQAEMTSLAKRLAAQYPATNAGGDLRVLSLQDEIVGPVRPALLALLAAVGLVLLIACVNVANLLLARAKARQREIAVRLALGATRWRLLRQMLTESTILALIGGLLGLVWAKWGVSLIIAQIPGKVLAQMPYLRGLSLNAGVVEFTFVASILTGIAFGVLPALQTSSSNPQEALAEGGRTMGGTAHHRLRNALVISEIALSSVLLIGAGLLMKSLNRLLHVDVGYQTESLLAAEISTPAAAYSDQKRNEILTHQILERAQNMPGVRSAALIDITPLKGGNTAHFTVQGRPAPAPDQLPQANTRDVSPNYFRVMGIPLQQGRFFSDHDGPDAPLVMLINKTLADRFFPGQDPVGQHLVFSFGTPQVIEIIGVVGDEKLGAPDKVTTPVIYSSTFQSNDTDLTLLLRSTADPQSLTTALRLTVNEIDPAILVNSAITVHKILADLPSVFIRRLPALLVGIFAALALLLAAIGLYGVLSYLVTQRTREIGVRMALGAQRRDIVRLLLAEGTRLAAVGIVIGLIAAVGFSRLMMGLLFGVRPTDPLVLLSVTGLILIVAVAACGLPASRASTVDPVVALRYE